MVTVAWKTELIALLQINATGIARYPGINQVPG